MEFENVNNFNLALEALNKKQKKWTFAKFVHRLKKLLRRAKPKLCTKPQTQEEYDNEQNEILERKLYLVAHFPDQDLKYFQYTTDYQVPQQQYHQNQQQYHHQTQLQYHQDLQHHQDEQQYHQTQQQYHQDQQEYHQHQQEFS